MAPRQPTFQQAFAILGCGLLMAAWGCAASESLAVSMLYIIGASILVGTILVFIGAAARFAASTIRRLFDRARGGQK
jgi:hypothetical protein